MDSMRRILARIAVSIALLLVVIYAGDTVSVRYGVPGHRDTLGQVEVETYYAVLKKDGKTEYMFAGTQNETCVKSLFPHLGYSPCWYLQRNKVRRIDI
ncbi:MAG TPA: hypothetical protein VKJ45_20835 [Blastocatellia bacterium]|nr:hypothetical protein [Blastocatellia bacterium]